MFSEIIRVINEVYAKAGAALGAHWGAFFALLVEGLKYAETVYDNLKDDIKALSDRVKAVEAIQTGSSSTTSSAFETAIRTILGNGNLAAQSGLGTSPSLALTTGGGTGEQNALRSFLVSMTAGSSPAAGAQFRITPPSTLVGPIRVRLSPSSGSAGGSIFDNDPYFTVNYGADGKTVSSIDIGVNAALTASTAYAIQGEVYQAP